MTLDYSAVCCDIYPIFVWNICRIMLPMKQLLRKTVNYCIGRKNCGKETKKVLPAIDWVWTQQAAVFGNFRQPPNHPARWCPQRLARTVKKGEYFRRPDMLSFALRSSGGYGRTVGSRSAMDAWFDLWMNLWLTHPCRYALTYRHYVARSPWSPSTISSKYISFLGHEESFLTEIFY